MRYQRLHRCFRAVVLAAVLLCIATPALLGQSTAANVSGRVTDETGAVIPSVKISITNNGTNARRQTTTNKEGYFVLPQLDPGTYTVRAQREGFSVTEIPNLVLNTNDRRDLQIKLKVGSATESITVDGSLAGVETSSAISTVVDRKFVENMPLNGRSFQSLLLLTPGVVMTNSYGQLSFNGQRTSSNYFTVDGVSANTGVTTASFAYYDTTLNGGSAGFNAFGGTNGLISVDALEEFKVQSSTYSAEFGRQPGGQVQMTSRSGTNNFHGTLFDYFRNDALDATDFFDKFYQTKKAALRQNDFGGTLGGPVTLPGLYNGKDRTFFFFSYEGLRMLQPNPASKKKVPALWLRQDSRLDAGIKAILNGYPLPNGPDNVNSLGQLDGTAAFTYSTSDPKNMDSYSIRLDHTIGSRLTLFGRYSDSPSNTASWTLNNLARTELNSRTLTIGATAQPANSVSNEFRANYSNSEGNKVSEWQEKWGAVIPSMSVFGDSPVLKESSSSLVFTVINTGFLYIGQTMGNRQRQWNFVDNVSWMRGNHTLKFGADYRYMFPKYAPGNQVNLYFSTLATLTANQAYSAGTTVNDSVVSVFPNLSLYAQDSWRASRKLTLDYGVRWEFNPAPYGRHASDMRYVEGWENPANIVLAPEGTAPYETSYRAFAPRLGASYQLSNTSGWETVLRGGYGLYYDIGTAMAAASVGSYPHTRKRSTPRAAYPLSASVLDYPTPLVVGTSYPAYQSFSGVIRNFTLPRTHQWTVTVEQSLGQNQGLSVSYVANSGQRLFRRYYFVSPNSNFTNSYVYVSRNDGDYGDVSNYNALQVQFQRRMAKGLQVLANYTWSHALDTGSDDTSYTNIGLGQGRRQSFGNSYFDRRQTFNTAISYEFPKLGALQNSALNVVRTTFLNGWAVDGVFKAQTASPVDVYYQVYTGVSYEKYRPDLNPGVSLWVSDPSTPGGTRLNRAAFKTPAHSSSPTGNGNMARNQIYGFGSNQLDFAIRREFPLSEGLKLQFRAEMFNVLNHVNMGAPDAYLGQLSPTGLTENATFGQPSSTLSRSLSSSGSTAGLSSLYNMGGPRSAQFALKLVF